jgi:polyisoprenoid-binding protein YceI
VRRWRARLVAGLLVVATATPAAAQRWVVDPARSRIGFTATWLGKPVPGNFRRWTAAIRLDPANLPAAQISVDIDTASAATGDRTVDGALPGEDWFSVAASPRARFVATAVTAAGPGRYSARGTLIIRGKARPVTFVFSLAINGDAAAANGSLVLDRRWFDLGLESDATAAYVAFAVPVTIAIAARRAC